MPEDVEVDTGHGPFTGAEGMAYLVDNPPSNVSEPSGVVQGLVVHAHWAECYGETLSEARQVDST